MLFANNSWNNTLVLNRTRQVFKMLLQADVQTSFPSVVFYNSSNKCSLVPQRNIVITNQDNLHLSCFIQRNEENHIKCIWTRIALVFIHIFIIIVIIWHYIIPSCMPNNAYLSSLAKIHHTNTKWISKTYLHKCRTHPVLVLHNFSQKFKI